MINNQWNSNDIDYEGSRRSFLEYLNMFKYTTDQRQMAIGERNTEFLVNLCQQGDKSAERSFQFLFDRSLHQFYFNK